MCGIVGYTGSEKAAPIILDGLKRLEYRGYDSAGIAVAEKSGEIIIKKSKGELENLSKLTKHGKIFGGVCGIGHTRWATHGEPSEKNAHPHKSDNEVVVAVHNGIIENFAPLKEKLIKLGYSFYSETDTEVATKLVDYYYKQYNDPLRALSEFALRARGSYALAVMFKDFEDMIYAIRRNSPMIIGYENGAAYLASDVPAILKYVRQVYYIENEEIVTLSKGGVKFYNLDREEIQKSATEIAWDAAAAEKGGWDHYMLKEIYEQPQAVKNTLVYYMKDGEIDLSELKLPEYYLKDISGILITGCGSAYHVGMVAQYVIENIAKLPVRVELASELRYRNAVTSGKELVIVISQSGETADSLAALKWAKEKGLKVLSIVNVLGSSIARESDSVFYTKAGPEISVATTKAYSCQLIAVYLIALRLALIRNAIDRSRYESLKKELLTLPDKIQTILDNKADIQKFASENVDKKDMFFIGRGIDYAVSVESSLKMKEISYVHSEAYAAGELKHGTISLVEEGTLIFGILTQSKLIEKTVSNLLETVSRGAYIAVLASENLKDIPQEFKRIFRVPATDNYFSASLAVVTMQLFAYYVCVLRGNNVDKPRNLAKSVTVE